MKIKSIQIGKAEKIQVYDGRVFDSGIHKKPVNGKIFLDKLGLKNDDVMGNPYHGGEGRVLFMSSLDAFKFWENYVSDKSLLTPGAIGENVTMESLDEASLLIGDIFELGETKIQVTMPRIPCPVFAKKLGLTNAMELQHQCPYPGVLFRVLETGYIEAGDELKLIESHKTKMSLIQFLHMFKNGGKITRVDFEILEKTKFIPDNFISVVVGQKRVV